MRASILGQITVVSDTFMGEIMLYSTCKMGDAVPGYIGPVCVPESYTEPQCSGRWGNDEL